MTTSHALLLESFGPIPGGLAVREIPTQTPRPGQLLIKMLAAPINPADINIIEGRYGELPPLPAVIGNEGAGIVQEVGPDTPGWQPGDLAVLLKRGSWAEFVTVPATDAFQLPPQTDPLLACQMGVNPPTALLMLEKFENLQPGDWIAQNAANSSVGRCVIQIARDLGLRTINVVRRPELVHDLQALGADVVVTEETDLRNTVEDLCNGSRPKLALNAVGGASALNLSNALAPSGTLVTYGAMSKQPLKIPNGQLIFSDLRFRGFWLTRWKQTATPTEQATTFQKLIKITASCHLQLPVQASFPIGQFAEALAEASKPGRTGKVILRL